MSPDRPGGGLARRAVLALAAPLTLAACGFAPAYAPGGAGDRLGGRIDLGVPDTPEGFLLRARLEDRLGRATAPVARLDVGIAIDVEPAAVTPERAITRYDLDGRAAWRLADAGGRTLAEDIARAFTGYSATGTTIATRAAEADARARLMVLLADAIVARLLALPPATWAGVLP